MLCPLTEIIYLPLAELLEVIKVPCQAELSIILLVGLGTGLGAIASGELELLEDEGLCGAELQPAASNASIETAKNAFFINVLLISHIISLIKRKSIWF